jgi:hypothetical protein
MTAADRVAEVAEDNYIEAKNVLCDAVESAHRACHVLPANVFAALRRLQNCRENLDEAVEAARR